MNAATAMPFVFLSRCPGSSFEGHSPEMGPGSGTWRCGEPENNKARARALVGRGLHGALVGSEAQRTQPPTLLWEQTFGPE